MTNNKRFEEFEKSYLKRYYPLANTLQILGRTYPVIIIPADQEFRNKSFTQILDIDQLLDEDESHLWKFDTAEHQKYVHSPYFEEYSRLVGENIRFPDRPGFMFLKFNKDAMENGIRKITAKVGTYAENVYGTNVLDYEMRKTFDVFECITDENWDAVKRFSKARENFGQDPIRFPVKTNSLIGVQMLVGIKDKQTGEYNIIMAERSDKVVTAPGKYQLMPSGGFELMTTQRNGKYSMQEVMYSFHMGVCVFREFLEEIMGVGENRQVSGDPVQDVLYDPHIIRIERMLQNGEARMYFLGDCLNLLGMRHELSFALLIDEPDVFPYEFSGSYECKKGKLITDINIRTMEEHPEIVDKLHSSSAGMLKLAEYLL